MRHGFRGSVAPVAAGLALAVAAGAATACSQAPSPVTRRAPASQEAAPANGSAPHGAAATAVPHSSEAEPKSASPTSSPAVPAVPAVPAAGTAQAAPSGASSAAPATSPKVVPLTPLPVPPLQTAAGAPAAGAGGTAPGPIPAAVAGSSANSAANPAAANPSVIVVDTPDYDPDTQLTLAQAAKAERERKSESTPTRIVINNKTLHRYAKGGQLTVAAPKKEGAPAAPAGAAAAATAANAEHGEAYWRGRALEIRQRWRKAADRIKELEQDVSEWRRRFYAQDDPYVRDGQIKPAWDRALDELRESRKAVQDAKKQLVDFLEEGRVAGALPGWLREGIDQEPKEEKPVDPTQPIEAPIYKDSGQ